MHPMQATYATLYASASNGNGTNEQALVHACNLLLCHATMAQLKALALTNGVYVPRPTANAYRAALVRHVQVVASLQGPIA